MLSGVALGVAAAAAEGLGGAAAGKALIQRLGPRGGENLCKRLGVDVAQRDIAVRVEAAGHHCPVGQHAELVAHTADGVVCADALRVDQNVAARDAVFEQVMKHPRRLVVFGSGKDGSGLALYAHRHGARISIVTEPQTLSAAIRELADEDNADEWTFLLDGDNADLDDIMTTAFVLSMDSKLLCSEDCKGLCAKCGKNLNEGPCQCKPDVDPRFAALQQLLQ